MKKIILGFFVTTHLLLAQEGTNVEESSQSQPAQTEVVATDLSDGLEINQKTAIIVLFGPGGFQNGQPNPVGIPPSIPDIEITYLRSDGFEYSIGLPGLFASGLRYRTGPYFYGQAGGALVLSANGLGPGVYTGFGLSLERTNRWTVDLSLKQFLAYNLSETKGKITTPYAVRVGLGYQW